MFDPERYESNKSAAARDAEEFVPKLVGDMVWKKNEVIMDYGCGAGSTGAKLILPKVESCDSKMFSVDISKEMLEHAKKAYPSPRISYAVGDILSDDFQHRNMKFDKIFAVHVLHFVKNYRYVR
jgi:cyclopropane fatty-acyl-phospholipid synthase-like methyltransferase